METREDNIELYARISVAAKYNTRLTSPFEARIDKASIVDGRPAGVIAKNNNFAAAAFDKAYIQAKDFVMNSIRCLRPKESAAYIKNDKIFHKVIGGKTYCTVSKEVDDILKCPGHYITIVHSHPKHSDGATCPISFSDFETLNSRPGVIRFDAINADGEYSLLKKRHSDKILSSKTMDEFSNIYQNEAVLYAKERADVDEDCIDFLMIRKILASRHTLGLSDREVKKGYKYYEALQKKILSAFVHSFWQKYVAELNVIYETNFSNLY